MNNNEKEIRRIRLEDLDSSLQNILLNRVTKDDPTWNKIVKVIDDLYDKTHIEKKEVKITITNKDPDNQSVKVLIGSKTYTSNFTCYNTDRYRIVITPVAFKNAGACNVALTGNFRSDTNIIVDKTTNIVDSTTDTTKPTYSIKVKIGSRDDGGLYPTLGMNETYIWNPSTINDKVGECNPDNVIDILTIWKYGENDYSSYYAFYGGNSVSGLFKTFSSTIITPKGDRYAIAENVDNSEFNKSGDLNNPPKLSTKQMYDLFYTYLGEWITVEINLTK